MTSNSGNVFELQRRLNKDRQAVLERLFNEHATALRIFLRGRLGHGEELEDVLQEVFVRLARMDDLPERLEAGRKGSKTFIFTIANNLIVDMERRRAVRYRYNEAESADAILSYSLDKYAGRYSNDLMGELEIRENGDGFDFLYGQGMKGHFTHLHFDTFLSQTPAPVALSNDGNVPAVFGMDVDGSISTLTLGGVVYTKN